MKIDGYNIRTIENWISIGSSVARLNRESGQTPERSRHRSGERFCISYVTGKIFSGKAQESMDPKSGELLD